MEDSSYFILYIRADIFSQEYQIYKLPLFPTKIGSDSGSVSTLPWGDSIGLDFSLNGRRRHPARIRPMPMPYYQFHCTARFGGLPERMAIAAVSSFIYFIGGYLWMNTFDSSRADMVLPTNVYMIDIDNPGPPPPALPLFNKMHSGKRSPVAWTIGGKIYVMPTVFVTGETPGHFECLDPDAEYQSWKILPSPPFFNDPSKFTIPSTIDHTECSHLLLVKNHIVLGSSLIITTHQGDFYRFDTAEPNRGWSSVSLKFGSERLKFLPFDRRMSVPLQDGIVFSHLDSDSFPAPDMLCVDEFSYECRSRESEPYISPSWVEKSFLKSQSNILPGNSYVCGIECDASRTLKLSFVSPVTIPIQREELVRRSGPQTEVARIGDGLILFVRRGKERDEYCAVEYYSLNVVRIQEQGGEFVASSLSSALLSSAGEMPDHICSFLSKDGKFTTGF